MFANNPIKNAKGIHPEKKLYRVVTANHENDKGFEKLKEYFNSGVLAYSGIQVMEVDSVRRNESRTGVIVEGILLDKNGAPLYPNDPAKNGVKVEIPYDQQNVEVKPGTWFDDKKVAAEFDAVINTKTKETVANIKALLEKIEIFQDELIAKAK